MAIHTELRLYLQQLKQVMLDINLWQSTLPSQESLQSQQPFAIDTLSPTEWLQWIFIPRMHALVDANAELPNKIAITPYLEEALTQFEQIEKLLIPIKKIETLLSEKLANKLSS